MVLPNCWNKTNLSDLDPLIGPSPVWVEWTIHTGGTNNTNSNHLHISSLIDTFVSRMMWPWAKCIRKKDKWQSIQHEWEFQPKFVDFPFKIKIVQESYKTTVDDDSYHLISDHQLQKSIGSCRNWISCDYATTAFEFRGPSLKSNFRSCHTWTFVKVTTWLTGGCLLPCHRSDHPPSGYWWLYNIHRQKIRSVLYATTSV